MSETSPKISFCVRQQVRKEQPVDPRMANVKKPERSPEDIAAIERFYETGRGAKDNSRLCHLI